MKRLQDYEGIPSSLTVGGSNAFPLLISGILLLSEHRPQFRVRLRIWLALALWFLAAQLSYLLARELRLDENMWLNHMVFLTIISTALQLPKLLTWTSAVLHSLAFLALTLFIGEEGEGAPSLGLQSLDDFEMFPLCFKVAWWFAGFKLVSWLINLIIYTQFQILKVKARYLVHELAYSVFFCLFFRAPLETLIPQACSRGTEWQCSVIDLSIYTFNLDNAPPRIGPF